MSNAETTLLRDGFPFRFLSLTPFETPDLRLVAALLRSRIPATIDLGRNAQLWPSVFDALPNLAQTARRFKTPLGLRIPEGVQVQLPEEVNACIDFLVLGEGVGVAAGPSPFWVLHQVTSVASASQALENGAKALIVKGQESAGRVGHESTFVLLQRVLKLLACENIPVLAQGGIGLYTAPAAMVAGAAGLVVDAALAAMPECSLPDAFKQKLLNADGSEVRTLAGSTNVWVSNPKFLAGIEQLDLNALEQRMTNTDDTRVWAVGQDVAFAGQMAKRFSSVAELFSGLQQAIRAQLRQAQSLQVLKPGNAWAQSHGVRFPVAQGPMTRVSDTPEFAHAVARAGGLPFLALSLLNAASCRKLLEETTSQLGSMPWGVGVLGFADPAVLEPQLALLEEFKPSAVLIAGGRPAQAQAFTQRGVPAYLHVPSPGLLDLFLKEGARHFVFEGRECGGHVGPRYSFVLWEQAVSRMLEQDDLTSLHVLFAGGIHDEVSAAMVSVIAAPLAARGAKVGVLMGTAYITTPEAVQHGAVLEEFQRQTLEGQETALIETAPGHAIRCLPSGFIDLFNQEKERLSQAGVDTKAAWAQLESLTVGRLRIATKGQDRINGELVEVPLQQQLDEGMYMIGQVAALQNSLRTVEQLHRDVSEVAVQWLGQVSSPSVMHEDVPEPIAIVGMSCIYPGSENLESFWNNVLQGKDLVGEVPQDRWSVAQYYAGEHAEPNKSVSKWGGFIDPVAFDPLEFGIPPSTIPSVETVQLLSLKVAKDALADAGYANKWFNREKTAVIFGAEAGMDLANQYTFRNLWQQYAGDLPEALDKALPPLTEDSFPGMLVNVISGRIANRLGLGGVNYAVTSACASSLTAIELAVKELRNGSSDMALAGGADFHNGISDYLMFTSVGALSPKGRCRSFDAQADGIALGEGVGVVVLKRLSDAVADQDRIYAVIDGIAGSSDGKGLGLTAPRKEGQKRALERAYLQAGVLPAEVGLVEAHGTGTVVGDRTELSTLTEVFVAGGGVADQAVLGSVKSQIGHTKCAAGIAGLIKITKALHHKVLPGTLHVAQPNPGYQADTSPFKFTEKPLPWFSSHTRRAAVSAFGFGGANFHAVLSEWNGQGAQHNLPYNSQYSLQQRPHHGASEWPCELFVVRGNSPEEALQHIRKLSTWLEMTQKPARLADLACTLWQAGSGDVQFAWVDQNTESLKATLNKLLTGQVDKAVQLGKLQRSTRAAFLFSGQGSQHPGMLRDLFVYFPGLQAVFAQHPELAALVFPAKAHGEAAQLAQQIAVTDTRVAQPALGAVEWALHEWLDGFGVKPAMAAGHSYGELPALAAAGAIDPTALLSLSRQRALSILDAVGDDPGYMAAVSSDRLTIGALLEGFEGVVMANQNSPSQVVISGPTAAMDAALLHLKANGLACKPIATACAFHSPQLSDASVSFAQALRQINLKSPAFPVFSNKTSLPYDAGIDELVSTLAEQISSPVRWVEEVENMVAQGADLFVEIGPKRVLTGLLGKILPGSPIPVVAMDQAEGTLAGLLGALAQLAVSVQNFDASELFNGRSASVDLDKPETLAASTWWLDGAKAVPARPGNLRIVPPVTKPVVQVGHVSRPESVAATSVPVESSSAVFNYLNNMRELVNAQRDVLMSYLGTPDQPMSRNLIQPTVHQARFDSPIDSTSAARLPVPSSRLSSSVEVSPQPALSPAQVLLALVSERTGYPEETLDLDLDLEADLSIDSIKRVEITGELSDSLNLKNRLGANAAAQIEKLGQSKTLRHMLDLLEELLPVGEQPAVAATSTEPAVSDSAVNTGSAETLLLGIVSGTTGYPIEALESHLDLEADLSIDSIKRVEIVGQWLDALGLAAGQESRRKLSAALANARTLQDMLQVFNASQANEPSLASQAAAKAVNVEVEEQNIPFERYVLRSREIPETRERINLTGQFVCLTRDTLGVSDVLADLLKAQGAFVDSVYFQDGPHVLTSAAIKAEVLVHLWSIDPASRIADVKAFFTMARAAVLAGCKHILVVTALGLKPSMATSNPDRGAGLAGLVKSLAREFPDLNVRVLDVDADQAPAEVAHAVNLELMGKDRFNEVLRRGNSRYVVDVVPSILEAGQIQNLPLNSDSVVLLTGGAKGITALVAVELARRHGCKLELVGRSAAPQGEESEHTRGETDTKRLRQILLTAHPESKPAEIEKRIRTLLSEREFRQTMQLIQSVGAEVAYHALDVQDSAAFADLIQNIYQKHGRIDGVVHGAGVIEDKLLKDKTQESFERVFNTKVNAAQVLRDQIRDDVQFVVFFSSVASAFGNRGQADYASANDALDKIAHSWQARIKGRVLSVNWGPWADTGMVNDSLRKEYASKQIGLVPKDEGVFALLAELACTKVEAQVVLMSGKPASFLGDSISEAAGHGA
ncbi:acyl transferase domain-containing protein [Limnobacter thiooxidans]|uniref:Type I polyketide synthase n=1 Tax=Limnobacter thiooxidans TaxID=131080 RepID=A0AA86IZP7_9BURK|nr:acyl transferase domain-containing protein [Limnobacter thiooxidans]BET26629.1 type I polyketide synthase [Limnobacter thiooxidans]